MAMAGADLLGPQVVLVPVPLHPRRLRQRRFNQALLLARSLQQAYAEQTGQILRIDT